MRRGGPRLPKVSPRPAMPYPSTPCGQATPKTAFSSFRGWPAASPRPSFSLMDTPGGTPMNATAVYRLVFDKDFVARPGFRDVFFRIVGFFWVIGFSPPRGRKGGGKRNRIQWRTRWRHSVQRRGCRLVCRTWVANTFVHVHRASGAEGRFHDQGDNVKK
jgi:hypothetical protein